MSGLDLRKGLRTSAILEPARQLLRQHVTYYDKDRFFAPDIEVASQLIAQRHMNELMPAKLLPSL